MQIKACIFDLDGVLTDTADQHFNSWSKIATHFDLILTPEHNEQLKGVSRPDSLRKILDWSGKDVDRLEFDRLLVEKNEHYLEGISQLSKADILPGVVDFLDDLEANQTKSESCASDCRPAGCGRDLSEATGRPDRHTIAEVRTLIEGAFAPYVRQSVVRPLSARQVDELRKRVFQYLEELDQGEARLSSQDAK